MPAPDSFDYAIIRLVPSVERGECLNVGVIVHCRVRGYLAARVELDERRLSALASVADVAEVRRHLHSIPLICAGGPGAGPIGQLSLAERWHWLVAPRSTVIQVSPAHAGLCDNPGTALERLFQRLVALPQPVPTEGAPT